MMLEAGVVLEVVVSVMVPDPWFKDEPLVLL
jgi:hypothetical protein